MTLLATHKVAHNGVDDTKTTLRAACRVRSLRALRSQLRSAECALKRAASSNTLEIVVPRFSTSPSRVRGTSDSTATDVIALAATTMLRGAQRRPRPAADAAALRAQLAVHRATAERLAVVRRAAAALVFATSTTAIAQRVSTTTTDINTVGNSIVDDELSSKIYENETDDISRDTTPQPQQQPPQSVQTPIGDNAQLDPATIIHTPPRSTPPSRPPQSRREMSQTSRSSRSPSPSRRIRSSSQRQAARSAAMLRNAEIAPILEVAIAQRLAEHSQRYHAAAAADKSVNLHEKNNSVAFHAIRDAVNSAVDSLPSLI